MSRLTTHVLDTQLTINYLKNSFEDANILSSMAFKFIAFGSGRFFTLLPQNSNIEKIHDFSHGGLLPQNPIVEYGSSLPKARHQVIPTIRKNLSEFINRRVSRTKAISCLIDDVTLSKKDYADNPLFKKCGVTYKDEIYFLIHQRNASDQLILKCLNASNAFWHSLCVLTEANIDLSSSTELTLEKIQEICLKVKMVIVGAYDGEGYIFWEPQ